MPKTSPVQNDTTKPLVEALEELLAILRTGLHADDRPGCHICAAIARAQAAVAAAPSEERAP